MASLAGASSTSWEEEIAEAAIPFMNARVCFYRTASGGEGYDPVTGTGGDGGIELLFVGKARVQHIRAAREFTTAYETNATRYFRYQIDVNDNPPFIYEDTKSRVLDGGRDPMLETLVLTVNAAVNSSHRAVRTVELAANMKPQKWNWDVDEAGQVVPK